ncbi:uncharacterized protein [Excalfactoria chinensis]|uniref:uncharacterized protein n=1 Tax=Excalfactoria chinensis TaxID=46218 RepID=UPI003B3B82FA
MAPSRRKVTARKDVETQTEVPSTGRRKAAARRSVKTQTEVHKRHASVQVTGCSECHSLALEVPVDGSCACFRCDQINDLLSMVVCLKEEVERLRSIKDSENEIDWWCQALLASGSRNIAEAPQGACPPRLPHKQVIERSMQTDGAPATVRPQPSPTPSNSNEELRGVGLLAEPLSYSSRSDQNSLREKDGWKQIPARRAGYPRPRPCSVPQVPLQNRFEALEPVEEVSVDVEAGPSVREPRGNTKTILFSSCIETDEYYKDSIDISHNKACNNSVSVQTRFARRGRGPSAMGQKLCTWFRSTRTACAETQEAAGSEEPACVLCGRVDEYSTILGRRREGDGFYFHSFCVLCFVCGSSGATIICADLDCERSFHLPCASEGQCVTQHFNRYRAFCWEHRPQQAVQAAPELNTTCIICMEPVDDSRSYGTMVCPACQHAWFHRACIQEQALSAGIYCFQCPLCRDWNSLIPEMLTMGIRIPFRNPTWEDNNAYAALGDRHRRCDASDCLYPLGREQLGEGPWQLLLCSSCAAQGTHRLCSNLSQDTTSWECDSCAGEGTASGTSSALAGLSNTSQQGLQPSESSVSPESSSSGTSSQAPSGPDHRSCVPESSGLSIQSRTDRRRIPARLRRDENILNESRGRRGRTHSAALMAESSTDSTNLRCRQGQRARTRSRSPLRRRAPESASRPQRHRGSGPTATPGAQSCTRSSSTPAAPGSSRASPAADGSPSRHPGRARTRSRSPLHRRAADTDSQPRRRRTSRSRRRGPAQGRSYSRVPRRAQHITGRPC